MITVVPFPNSLKILIVRLTKLPYFRFDKTDIRSQTSRAKHCKLIEIIQSGLRFFLLNRQNTGKICQPDVFHRFTSLKQPSQEIDILLLHILTHRFISEQYIPLVNNDDKFAARHTAEPGKCLRKGIHFLFHLFRITDLQLLDCLFCNVSNHLLWSTGRIDTLCSFANGIMICPGFGQRGTEGKIVAAHYTRTHDIPTFGICLGMQMIVVEFARNVLGYEDANSRELDEKTEHNVIDIMEDQKNITDLGGTMRLGAYECVLKQGSRAFEIYKKEHIQERHRHRYEFNNSFEQEYERAGMKCVGRNPESDLVEIVEIPGLKWYIGTQFHPEYSSTVLNPHPLFLDFVKTAIACKKGKK